MTTAKLIQKAEQMTLSGQLLPRNMIIQLLEIDPDSEQANLLGAAARRVAEAVTGNQARIWASIGVDYQPCPMNCRFCSFGEAWGATKNAYTLSVDEIVSHAKAFVDNGVDWITLRTTEDYGMAELNALANKIREQVPGDYQLVANTGDLNAGRANELKDAGFAIAYHAIRLKEGIDTPFQPQLRGKTLEEIGKSNLDLAFLIEPVGVEHTNEEIADTFLLTLKYGAKLSGAMARVPVVGTPLFDLGALPERRLAQLIAVIRLASGYCAPDICVHPPSKLAMDWGANVVVVDIGAVPRAIGVANCEWNGFDINTARAWFEACGYHQGPKID